MKQKMMTLALIFFCVGPVFADYFSQEEKNPLELLEDAPEQVVSMKGKLIFKLFPGPPEYSSVEEGDRADYCYVLQLDDDSRALALATPVAGPANSLTDIVSRSNYGDLFLAMDDGMKNVCHKYVNEQVTVEGHLFHAHTTHHYTPVLIDVKMIKIAEK
jgi:hypothetical protein